MANWKKVIVSGSVAELSVVSASQFSGSFEGDGSNLTGLSADSVAFSNITGLPTLFSGSAQVDGSSISSNTVGFGGVSVALGSSDSTPAFDLQDATGLPIGTGTTGTLATTRGGTGLTSPTAGEVMIGAGNQAMTTRAFGISNNNVVKIDSTTVADDEYARFTANGLESRSPSEVASDIGAITDADGVFSSSAQVTFGDIGSLPSGLVSGSSQIDGSSISSNTVNFGGVSVALGGSDTTPAFDLSDATSLPIGDGTSGTLPVNRGGTGVTSLSSGQVLIGAGASDVTTRAIGISDDNIVEIDDADVANGDYAKFTANGLQGRSTSEVASDIGAITDADGVFSGSAQVAMGGDISGNANNATVEKVQGVALTSGEATQLANINTVTISNTQWGYVGAMNQGVATSDDVSFASGSFADVRISGNLTVTGTQTELQVTNLNVDDQFILINSGSASGDTGIIFGGAEVGSANAGAALYFDDNDDVFALASNVAAGATSATVVSKIGNIEDASGAPSAAPTFQGIGTIHIQTGLSGVSDNNIWIYS